MNSLSYNPFNSFNNHIADGLKAIREVKDFLRTTQGQSPHYLGELKLGRIPVIEGDLILSGGNSWIDNPEYGDTNKRIDRMINTAIVISLAVPIVIIGLAASYFGGPFRRGIVTSLFVGMLPTSSLTGVSLLGLPLGLYLLNLARTSNPLNNTIFGVAFLALSYVGLHFAAREVKNEVDQISLGSLRKPLPLAITERLIKVGHSFIAKHIIL